MTVLRAYARERLPLLVFGPAIGLLAAVTVWASATGALTPVRIAAMALAVALFVVRFRIWDDLEDRERDHLYFPDRLVVRTDPRVFEQWRLRLGAAHVALLASLGAWTALAAVVAVEAIFAVAYWSRPGLPASVWRFPVLLAKYPAFVVATSFVVPAPSAPRLAAAALAVYAGAWIYEAVHAPRSEGVLS